MKKILSMMGLAGLLLTTSCSPFSVTSDYRASANFNTYRTYKLQVDQLKMNDLDEDRVLNELSRQLQMKGLAVADNPDLIIHVKATHKKVTDVNAGPGLGFGMGWSRPFGWGMGVNRTWTTNYNEGALIFDFVDARTNKLVWQGVGSGISVDSPERKREQIPQIVSEILAQYPPRPMAR